MMMKTLPCIFNEDEFVIQQEIPAMKGHAIPISQWDSAKQFFAINPVRECGDSRKKENVSVMRNFLFEFDTIPIEEQKSLFRKHKGIVSMATYSGNKSIHFIIQVADTPTTNDEYRYVWNLLKDRYFQSADTQCNDCIRLSRTPNAVRENNKKQIQIWNTLQPLFLNWKPMYSRINEMKAMSREYRRATPITRNEKLTYEAECVLNGDYPKGERDAIIRIGIPYLFFNGYVLDEVLENNMSARNNPLTIKNYYHRLETGYYG